MSLYGIAIKDDSPEEGIALTSNCSKLYILLSHRIKLGRFMIFQEAKPFRL
jgi:hypothetical protein